MEIELETSKISTEGKEDVILANFDQERLLDELFGKPLENAQVEVKIKTAIVKVTTDTEVSKDDIKKLPTDTLLKLS